ncbi:hypothetical protein E1212_23800 [Jiangella ureilytica]|uniref:Uncharacterized protein n=1 Tax=Jiangella ureilytica TaxID=2530374 RepID=A0A4R4RFP8_9ACTN|nr:hypothetical protein [Jiangella ureilytica]TDC47619.1 hypothetical protein E1212_23800 [Jiangella ureilytica]
MTLRTQLSDLAADAPDAGALDLGLLRGRIIRRRRGRLAAAGSAVVLVAAMSTAAAAGLLDQGDGATPPIARTTPTPSGLPTVDKSPAPGPQQAFGSPACGEDLTAQGPAPETPLEMTVDLDDVVGLGVSGTRIGTATVTNVSDQPFAGIATPAPEAYLVHGDSVVTVPDAALLDWAHVTLAPGESTTFPVESSLRQCTPDTEPEFAPLQPGPHQVYVELRFSDGLALYSGPIEVEVE